MFRVGGATYDGVNLKVMRCLARNRRGDTKTGFQEGAHRNMAPTAQASSESPPQIMLLIPLMCRARSTSSRSYSMCATESSRGIAWRLR